MDNTLLRDGVVVSQSVPVRDQSAALQIGERLQTAMDSDRHRRCFEKGREFLGVAFASEAFPGDLRGRREH